MPNTSVLNQIYVGDEEIWEFLFILFQMFEIRRKLKFRRHTREYGYIHFPVNRNTVCLKDL